MCHHCLSINELMDIWVVSTFRLLWILLLWTLVHMLMWTYVFNSLACVLIFPSIRIFSNESVLHIRLPKYWSFSFSISPSNEYSGMISSTIDGLISLQSKELFKSRLQHHSSKASIPQCSAFFTVQISHPYMTPGKTITWTRQSFVGKVMSLLFNMLSRLVIGFLPRSKCLLISWL